MKTPLSYSTPNVITWHQSCGGHADNGVAPHAVRLLHETVELALACGASPQQLGAAVSEEIAKATHRNWPLPITVQMPLLPERRREIIDEMADTQILRSVLLHYAGIAPIEMMSGRESKFQLVQQRDFHADENGVLWRRKS